MKDPRTELNEIIGLLDKKGLKKYATDLKSIDAAYLRPRYPEYKKQLTDPNTPFAEKDDDITYLTPMDAVKERTEKYLDYLDDVNPSNVNNLIQLSKDLNKKISEGKISILDVEKRFNSAIEPVKKTLLKFFLDEAKKVTQRMASDKLDSLSDICLKKGYDALAFRLKEASDKLATHPREKEHTIPSLEAIHEYMEDYKHYIAKVEKLKSVYTECSKIIEGFLSTFRAEMHKAGQDKKTEDASAKKINKLVEEADIKIDRKIRDVERLLPAHPRSK